MHMDISKFRFRASFPPISPLLCLEQIYYLEKIIFIRRNLKIFSFYGFAPRFRFIEYEIHFRSVPGGYCLVILSFDCCATYASRAF